MDAAVLEEGRRTCQQVLSQNPASGLAQQTLRRIEELLGGQRAPEQPTATSDFPLEMEEEAVLEERINAFETQFLQYGDEVMLPLIRELPGEKQALRRALLYPFDTVRKNREQNPLRNAAKARREAKALNQNWQLFLLGMSDPNFFAMDTLKESHPLYGRVVAGFAPIARMMVFHPRMEAQNEIDRLVVLHECEHIPQMSLRRMSSPQLYVQLYGGNMPIPRLVVDDDYQAYGLEIEAMNLRMGGQLEVLGKRGQQTPYPELLREFGGRPDQWMMMEMLSRYARAYYAEDCDAACNRYGPEYRRLNKVSALHDGYEVYEVGADRRLQQVLQA